MKKTYLATAVAALFASPITTAIAADTLLDDVVVSSSRSEQRSFDAPAAIQSLSREVIQDSGPQMNASESLNKIPGIVASNRQNYAQDLQISIRGFGSRTKFGVRGVRLIIDGIPATIPDGQGQSSSISLTSVDRIEVLRGPMAQLYGNSAGGVVQAFTREAPEVTELMLQGYYGSYGTYRTDWQYAQKIGQFGLVADYSTFKTDGYRQNSQTERNQFNGKFTYDHDDKTKFTLIANYFDMPYAYDPVGLTRALINSNGPEYSRYYGSVNRLRKTIEQTQVGAIFDRKLDNQSTLSLRVYSGKRTNTHFNNDTAYVAGSTYPSWVGLDRDYKGVGLEYGTQGILFNKLITTKVGFSYDESSEISTKGRANGSGEIEYPLVLSRNENRKAQNMDYFGQMTLRASDQISLIGGLRSTSVKLSNNDYITSDGNSTGSVTYSAINPVFGLTYHIADTANLYLNYGRGFETPTLSEMGYENRTGSTTAIDQGFNRRLLAAKSDQYEVGMKWLPNRLTRVDLAAFYIATKNEIIVDRTVVVDSSYRNISGTQRRGVELATQTLLANSLKHTAALTFLDATFNKSEGTVVGGNPLPGVPAKVLFTDVSWSSTDFRKDKYKQVLGTTVTAEFIAMGRVYSDDAATNSKSAPGYGLTNLKLKHKFDVSGVTYTTYGSLNNIFDKQYIGSVIVGDGNPLEPAPGKNWMLGVNATARF
jgi:iron complex outermembrane receptor protein